MSTDGCTVATGAVVRATVPGTVWTAHGVKATGWTALGHWNWSYHWENSLSEWQLNQIEVSHILCTCTCYSSYKYMYCTVCMIYVHIALYMHQCSAYIGWY